MTSKVLAGLAALAISPLALGQAATLTNSIGMEFVLIQPGEFTVGRFEPPHVRPPAPGAAVPRIIDAGDLVVHLMRGDANGDEVMGRDEWIRFAQGLYSALDTEGAGRLIRPQVTAGWPRALGAPGFGSPGFGQPENVAARNTAATLFRLADRDGDDYVTSTEWSTLYAGWFESWAGEAASLTADRLATGLRSTLPYPAAPAPLTAEEYARIEHDAQAAYSDGFTVRINEAYYIGRFEVTQAQWERVMGSNPSTFTAALLGADASRHPVDSVTWELAREFAHRLNVLEGADIYRLPSEFEWEYAARAGRVGEISWGEARRQGYFGIGGNQATRPVGSMEPNAWGLYDTLGNVWEWVNDYYNEKIFADPVPPVSGTTHVLKGGGFVSDVKNATPSTHAAGPGNGFDIGLRLVRRASPP